MQGPFSLLATLFVSLALSYLGLAQSTTSSILTLDGSSWIWTDEATSQPGGLSAPAGPRGFRRTFTSPFGKVSQSAEILISVDDQFILTVNGNYIDASSGEEAWKKGQYYTNIPLDSSDNVFAVHASNGVQGAAGIIATIRIRYQDGDSEIFRTDTTWLTTPNEPQTDFESTNAVLKNWTAATSLGMYGMPPWYTLVETQREKAISSNSPESNSATSGTSTTMGTTSATVQASVATQSSPANSSSKVMAHWIEMCYAVMVVVSLSWLWI